MALGLISPFLTSLDGLLLRHSSRLNQTILVLQGCLNTPLYKVFLKTHSPPHGQFMGMRILHKQTEPLPSMPCTSVLTGNLVAVVSMYTITPAIPHTDFATGIFSFEDWERCNVGKPISGT